MNTNPCDPSAECDSEQAIRGFFKKWASVDAQRVLIKYPELVFDHIDRDHKLSKYRAMFALARLKLNILPKHVYLYVLQSFIGEASIKDFENFDIYVRGILNGFAADSKFEMQKFDMFMKAKLSTVSYSTSEIKETTDAFHSAVDILKESINKITAATSKLEANLEANLKISEQQKRSNIRFDAPSFYPFQKTMDITGYQNGKVFLPINAERRLDFHTAKMLNATFSQIDMQFLKALSLFEEEPLAVVASIAWSDLLVLFPNDPNMSPETAAIEFYKKFKTKYPGAQTSSLQKWK